MEESIERTQSIIELKDISSKSSRKSLLNKKNDKNDDVENEFSELDTFRKDKSVSN